MTENKGIDKELSDLRTEVYEARNLVIKSDNLLRTLHAEVKAVGKTQEQFEKRHLISSIGAYVLFAALAAGAAILAGTAVSRAAVETAEESLAEATERVQTAEVEAREAKEALEGRLEAERIAASIFQSISSEELDDQLAGLEKLDAFDMGRVPRILKELIEGRAREVRSNIVQSAWERGRRAFQAERMDAAVQDLEVVVRHSSAMPDDHEPARRATAAYYLGVAQNRLGAHQEAVRALRLYVDDENSPPSMLPYAHLLLGDSLVAIERPGEARKVFSKGLELEPGGRHSQTLRRRIEGLGELTPGG